MGRTGTNAPGLDDIRESLGLQSVPQIWTETWERSTRSREGAAADWLADVSLAEACSEIGLSPETTDACLSDARVIRSSPALVALAWHCCWVIFRSGLDVRPSIDDWPMPGLLSGKQTPRLPAFFYAVVLLSGAGLVYEKNSARGIPDSVTSTTLRDLDLWIHECRLRTGRPGFLELSWLVYHFGGWLFALGRLHFDVRDNDVGFHVLQRTRGGRTGKRGGSGESGDGRELAVLAERGMRFRDDGQFADADRENAAQWWDASYSEDSESFQGSPVSPEGSVVRGPVRFLKSEWRRIMSGTSPVLGVHIPSAGPFHGPMTIEACDESFRAAVPFFREHFPEHAFRGFTCKSWLLDNQLARYLPASSNIVAFQRRFHLVPLRAATDAQALERMFAIAAEDLPVVFDWARAPQDTSLRRILARHALAGGRWRMGGGLIPAD
jgi:hypothetical protein